MNDLGSGIKLELLEEKKIEQYLDEETLKNINVLRVLSVTPSTNDYIKDYKLRKLPEKTAVFAEAQTKGRGRIGRTWFSPFGGGILGSLYWTLKQNLSGLSLVVGLAVAKALEKSGVHVKVKWPNDIYVEDKKIAGILIESEYKGLGALQNIFIGVGLNVHLNINVYDNNRHDNAIIDMTEILGYTPSRNKIAADLLTCLIAYLDKFEQYGLTYFLAIWQQYDYLINKQITVIRPNANVSENSIGYARGISQSGELLLEEKGELKAICVGDIKVRALD